MPSNPQPPSTAIRPATAPTPARPATAVPTTAAPYVRGAPKLSRLTTLNKVTARDQGNWMTAGNYCIEVTDCYESETRPPKLKPYFMVKLRVLANGKTPGEVPVGMDGAWMCHLDKDNADRDVRGFMNAILTPEELAKLDSEDDSVRLPFLASITQVVGAPSPLAGRRLLLAVVPKPLKSDPSKNFNVHKWYAIPPTEGTETST